MEFALRGVAPLPDRDSLFVALDGNDRFSRNEVGDPTLLFRYTKQQYAEAIRDLGVLRVAPAASYRDMEGDVARADDEMVKTTWLPREHVSARDVVSGKDIKIVSDVRMRHRGADYFVSCFSSAWDIRMFDDFGESTHCVVVRDIEAFAARLAVAGRRHFGGWYLHHAPTMYFDPREWRMDAHMSHATYKDFMFAYQEEYRFLWANHGGQPVDSAQVLELGPLTGIVEVVEKPGRAAPHA